jgi:hypothetical protein
MPLFLIWIFVLQCSFGYFVNLLPSRYIMLIASLLLLNHTLKIFQVLFSFSVFSIQLVQKFLPNFLSPIPFLSNIEPISLENTNLFILERELFFKIKLSLVIDNFVKV